jgi:hypothetical protein
MNPLLNVAGKLLNRNTLFIHRLKFSNLLIYSKINILKPSILSTKNKIIFKFSTTTTNKNSYIDRIAL